VSLSNYPPGVTGNEYAIGGAEHEWVEERVCPFCDEPQKMDHEAHHEFGVRAWCNNPDCGGSDGFEVLDPYEESPDEAYDRMRDDALTEGDRA